MRINALGNTATDFASDDCIAIDGTTNGSRKMKNDSLLKVTAQNALAGNVAEEFVENSTTTIPGKSYIYNGKLYVAESSYSGLFNPSFLKEVPLSSVAKITSYQQIFDNRYSNPASLNDVQPNSVTYIQRTANTTTANFPSDFGTGVGVLVTDKAYFGDNYRIFQFLTNIAGKKTWRRYYTWFNSSSSGSWSDWEIFYDATENPENQKVPTQQIFNNISTNPASLNDVQPNTVTYLQKTSATTTTDFPSDFGTGGGVLVTDKAYFGDGGYQVFQFLTKFSTKQVWRRIYTWLTSSGTGSWNAWEIFYDGGSKLFEIGPGKTYTSLRAGITAAYQVNGAKVVIYPGTYDLVTECSDILSTTLTNNFTPCPLGNDMHVFAHTGVYIKAIVEKTEEMTGTQFNSIKEHFEPFSYNAGNFIVENLNIESKNTRYCIHDDHSVTPYSVRHEYINCRMKRTTDSVTSSNNFVACIGGGLNKHSTIIIDGGYYESAPTTGIQSVESGDVNYAQQPISYHNMNSEEADSSITLKNVYFADKGYLRVSDYGPSTTLSKVYASGCRFGYPIMHKYEVANLGHDNITIAADWNNDVANKGSWTIAADGYTATWTPAS